jgi:hypothetical protein
MKKSFFLAAILLISLGMVQAQDKFFTKSGKISFYSKATLENIEAHNKTVTCVLDSKTGNLQFAVMMKAFEFEKALMQEHFNENYIESHKFPKAEFKGQVVNNSEVNYSKDGKYPVKVKGKLTLHGETRDVETTGTIEVNGGKIGADAVFNVTLADYKVQIPSMVKDNISKTVSITVDCSLEPFRG